MRTHTNSGYRFERFVLAVVAFAVFQSTAARDMVTADDVLAVYANSLVRINNLSDDARAFVVGKPEFSEPGYLKLDMNGDGNTDVVLLTRDLKREEIRIRIFICTNKCRQGKVEVVGADGDVLLQRIDAGTDIRESDSLTGRRRSIRLAHDGVKVLNFGKTEVVYYWDGKRKTLRKVTSGD